MNEYGYQQGRPPHQHRNYSDAPPTYEGQTSRYNSVKTNAGLAQSSYEFNKAVIPGLAFGFSGGNQVTQGQGDLFEQDGSGSLANPATNAQNEDLSEGELEDDDIYEPVADENDGSSKDLQTTEHEQDRAGSYSPAFSAGEVNESIDNDLHPPSNSFAPGMRPSANQPASHQPRRDMSAADQVRKVREDACAAISDLRLFDLPQQTYQNYNIDKSVLQSLFRELGLDMPLQDQACVSRTTAPPATVQPSPKPKATAQAKPVSAPSPGPNAVSSKPSPPKDGSESRKDRIARLLAAKSSRQPSVSQPAKPAAPNEDAGKETEAIAPSDSTSTEATTSLPNKPLAKSLEKSKLLHQKMEALRKAREAKALSSSVQSDVAQQLAQEPASDAAIAPANSMIVQPGLEPTTESFSSQLPAAPRGHGMKRPVASDFDTPSFASSKRQYGQPQEARQFLIHVSDDEDESDDDTEMDIETPEERSQSFAATAVDSSLLRNHPPLSASPYRGQQSPAHTPGRPKSIIGSENLSKMYRNIEEMKRRIKEAEASKQAKPSRSATPLETSAKTNSEHESPSSAAVPTDVSRASPASSAAGSAPREAPISSTTNGASPQTRPGPRRSLSRTAQERLTSMESERKNKELKMRIMRAKIAQMEREMAASLQEEEALYDQGEDEDLNDLMAESAAMADEAQPVEQAPAPPTASEVELPVGEPEAPQTLPSPTARPAPSIEAEVTSTDSPKDVPTNAEAGHVSDTMARQSTEEANETSEDDDAEMKDLTDAENSDDDSDDDQTSEPESPNEVVTADPHVAKADGDVAKDDQEDEDSTSESDSAAVETDLDQEASDGEISDEEPDLAQSAVVEQLEEPALQGEAQHGDATVQAEIETEAHIAAEQISDVDELMGVKQPINPTPTSDKTAEAVAGFRPYESPLSYFHAYRFHPEFQKAVKGGLRSLTYSNKIDVQKPMCPVELAGGECPRGPRCNFQHLGKMSTPDDQILMQLGSYGAGEGGDQEKFNNGLRTLLQELKGRESQDFAAISQAIIDYRAQFHGDKSKILPLGNVPI